MVREQFFGDHREVEAVRRIITSFRSNSGKTVIAGVGRYSTVLSAVDVVSDPCVKRSGAQWLIVQCLL